MLSKFLAGPSAVATAPSSAGLAAFRRLQEKALVEYQDGAHLTDRARRFRNQLIAGFSAGVMAVTAATWMISSPSVAVGAQTAVVADSSRDLTKHDLGSLRQAVLQLEKIAGDCYSARLAGDAASTDASVAAMRDAAANVRKELAQGHAGNHAADPDYKEAVQRVMAMANSDLGRMGVDLVKESIPLETGPAKKPKAASAPSMGG